MHLEILSAQQCELLSFITQFKRSFYLIGGTAIAFHKDIDYAETVEFLPGFEIDEQQIKLFLIEQSLTGI